MKLSRLAPSIFVLLWSTGFVGAKYGLPYADPFIFLSLRVFIAALVLFTVALFIKSPIAIGRRDLTWSAIIGFFLHACYLGGVFFAISQGFSAGVAAVVTSVQPVLVSLLAVKVLGEKLRSRQIIGLICGFLGVLLVLTPGLSNDLPVSGFVAILIALLGSTTATLLQKKFGSEIPIISGTAYQYIASAIVLLFAALATGGTSIQWSGHFIAAFVWLIAVLSVGAVLLLLWLLNTGSAASVSSLFYLVPPATAVEAYVLFGESLTRQEVVGIVVTAIGVWLVVRASS